MKYFLFLFILLASSCKKEMTRDEAFKLLNTENGYARNYSGNNDYYSVTISIKNANNEPLDKVRLEMLKCLESKGYVTLSNVGSSQSSFAGFNLGPRYDNYKVDLTSKGVKELEITNRNSFHPNMSFPAIEKKINEVSGIRKISDTENEISYTGYYSATEIAKCFCNIHSQDEDRIVTYTGFDANNACDVLNKSFTGKAKVVKFDSGWKLQEITETVDKKTKFTPDNLEPNTGSVPNTGKTPSNLDVGEIYRNIKIARNKQLSNPIESKCAQIQYSQFDNFVYFKIGEEMEGTEFLYQNENILYVGSYFDNETQGEEGAAIISGKIIDCQENIQTLEDVSEGMSPKRKIGKISCDKFNSLLNISTKLWSLYKSSNLKSFDFECN